MSDKKLPSGYNPVITDKRFIKAQFDPKFKIRRRKLDNAITTDERFSSKINSKRFNDKAPVDLYGRKFEDSDDDEQEKDIEKKDTKQPINNKPTTKTTKKEKEIKTPIVQQKNDNKKSVDNKKPDNKKPVVGKQDTKNDNRFSIPQKWKDDNLVEEQQNSEDESEEEVVEKVPIKPTTKSIKKAAAVVEEPKKKKADKKKVVVEEEESEEEVEQNGEEEDTTELVYGGFEYNSDTESSDEEGIIENELEEEEQEEEVPRGDATKRFAVLNCDWDNIRSKELFIIFNSFVPKGGNLLSVTVYPSDYGLQQIALEAQSGPNREIWTDLKKKQQEDLERDSKVEKQLEYDRKGDAESLDGEGFDLEKLRKYELNKLKYYYAVVECDSAATASTIYDECDGIDIEETANNLDLRFIPDEQEFTNEPRDICTEMPDSSANVDFQTNVLKGTTVDFTWDVDKSRRKKLTNLNDYEEDDIKMYLAEPEYSSDEEEQKMSRLKLRNKYRSLLFGNDNDDETSNIEEKDDLKVTFKSALEEAEDQDSDDESEDDISINFSDQGHSSSSEEDEDSDDESGEEEQDSDDESEEEDEEQSGDESIDQEVETDSDYDDGWQKELLAMESDDETATEITINPDLGKVGKKLLKDKQKREQGNVWSEYLDKRKSKKYEKLAEKKIREKEEEKKAQEDEKRRKKGIATPEEQKKRAELELLMMDSTEKRKGFNKRDLEREHKQNTKGDKKGAKKDKKKGKDDEDVNMEQFKIDTKDPRFINLYEKPDFAYDPTSSKFKKTHAVKEILDEKKRRRDESNNPSSTTAATTHIEKKAKPSDEMDRFKAMAKNIQRNSSKMNAKKEK